jgi:integrase
MHLRTLSLATVKLANNDHDTRAIQASLGHRNIQKTTRHTAAAPALSKEFFRD